MNQTNSFDTKQALKAGWAGTKKHLWFLVGVLVLFYGISAIPNLLDTMVPDTNEDAIFLTFFFLVAVVSWAVQMVMSMGLVKIGLKIIDEQPPTYNDFFSEYKKLFTVLGAGFLNGLIVCLGLVLFIIPGIYWALKYQFYIYRIVDADDGVFDALRNSGVITAGVKWRLFGFALLLMVINIVGGLCLGVGLFISMPVTFLAMAHVYRQLDGRLMPVVQPAPAAPVVVPPTA